MPGDKIKYLWPNGKTSHINITGERKYSRGAKDERYRYYLAPNFYVSQTLIDDFAVIVRTHVRITDATGVPVSPRKANSRRKDLCKDWWNGEWLSRMLAICQYLADGEKIVIGSRPEEQILIAAIPLSLYGPRGINEKALGQSSYEREEIFNLQDDEGDLEEIEVKP